MKRKILSLRRIILFVFIFLFAYSITSSQSYDNQSCCERDIGALRVKMPKDQVTDWGRWMQAASEQYFFEIPVAQKLGDPCPISLEFFDVDGLLENYERINKMLKAFGYGEVNQLQLKHQQKLQALDYLIVGKLIVDKKTGRTDVYYEEGYNQGSKERWGGDLLGSFLFKWELIDNHHNNTVVKTLETSWDGKITDFMGYINADDKKTQFNKITEMTKQAGNLDEIIYDYEQMPLSCKIKLEDDRDYVENGEEIKINLNEILDFKGRKAKQWQYLIAKVEKGKIINGKIHRGNKEYKIFEVGNGEVEIKYKAPDDCESQEEKITVYNTCEHREYIAGSNDFFDPEKEIGNKEFKIVCARGSIEYEHEIVVANPGYNETIKILGSVPFKMKKSNNKQNEPPKVEGKGTVNVSFKGSTPPCTMSQSTIVNVTLSGEVKTEKEEVYLIISIDEDWKKPTPWEWICLGTTFTKDRDFRMDWDGTEFKDMKFKVKDGFKVSESFTTVGVKGIHNWILHLKK